MDLQIAIVLGIMTLTIFLLVSELVRIDITAIITMLLLSWTGVLSSNEALSGFSSNAVIAMIAVMILGEGIAKTGMMTSFSKWLLGRIGNSKQRILGALSLSTGLISGVIQNIGAAALVLPSVMDISRRIKASPSEFIMPIGFMAIIGGTLTMVGSGHLILTNDLLIAADLEPYGLFAVTPVGFALLGASVLFFLLLGKIFLPKRAAGSLKETSQEKIMKSFSLRSEFSAFEIPADSPLCGKTVEESGIWNKHGINILALRSNGKTIFAPWRQTPLEAGAVLALYGDAEAVNRFAEQNKLLTAENTPGFDDLKDAAEFGFAEVIIPSRSELAGKTLREFALRRQFAVEPVILFSNGERVEEDFSDRKLKAGDSFILFGSWAHLREIKLSDSFVMATPIEAEVKNKSKTLHAAGSFILAIALAMSGFSIAISFLTGALVMVLLKVMTMQEAYKAVEWKVVFLLVGLIPLGIAMQNTGAAQFLAENVMRLINEENILLLLFSVAILSTGFSLVMSNVGAVVVLAPLVVGMAVIAGVDPRPLVLLAAVNAGNSFILPTHQVNALMMSAGGYETKDYFKAGGGITALFLVVSVKFFYYFYF
ncbi:MAG: SLC13 family permease [Balneolales bacterium]|nr:SLC13 family permease [Balneolales bacterium]